MPLSRLAALLALSDSETEKAICKMVSDKKLSALIDRTSAVVTFVGSESREGSLERWAAAVTETAALAGRICGLIQKDRAVSAL